MVVAKSDLRDRLILQSGSIVTLRVDVIVNAANSSLLGGGGVDGVIHRAAGPDLLAACRELRGCETGQVKATPAFDLPVRHVIHAVGPKWKTGSDVEKRLLANCYYNAMACADELQCRSIAFPALSTGAYGFPLDIAADIAVASVVEGLHKYPSQVVTLMSLPARNQKHLLKSVDRLGVRCSLKS